VSAAELEAYGWERGPDSVWRMKSPHLTLVTSDDDHDGYYSGIDDVDVIAVLSTIARNLRFVHALPLPVVLCDDCGCLLHVDEKSCPACLVWAERNAIAWSWSAC
jgi:hypothetical protein